MCIRREVCLVSEKKVVGVFILRIYFVGKVGGSYLLRVIGDGGRLGRSWGFMESRESWKCLL